MAHEVVMPQLGLSMDSGLIVRWLKLPGERVEKGDLIIEVESDKSIVEVEAVEEGFLHILEGPESGAIPVGKVIAYLLSEEEPLPGEAPQAVSGIGQAVGQESSQTSKGNLPVSSSVPVVSVHQERLRSSPAARRRARELGIDWRQAIPTGLRGQIKERDVLALIENQSPVREAEAAQITPVAKRMAESLGLDLAELARMNPGKRLERSDVELAVRQVFSQASNLEGATQVAPVAGEKTRREPISALRRLIADRMSNSAHTTAPVTLTTKADATELVRLREILKQDQPEANVPSYNVLLAALVSKALLEHPLLNASIGENEIVYREAVNIGVAVDTERGLVVPVLRDVQDKSLRELTEEAKDLLNRASQGKAMPDELSGGTFTITNLGFYDIDAFTPIINLPECAVLGVGRLVSEVIPVDGQPEIRTMLSLSLTFDHRLVDGAPAARFLQRVRQFVEQPYLWLSGI
jgi:pyruvate dehydrogenase E2 component (dihydrolipoamide acetyltransferase)